MRIGNLASLVAICALCAISSRAGANLAGGDPDLDNTEWRSSDCHFNDVEFYSAIGASLNWDGDETMLGQQESFLVSKDQRTVRIVNDAYAKDDVVKDTFTGTYTFAADGTSGSLVGDHSWKDESGQHEQRCSYTLSKRWTDEH
jgi:hypothetical protein